MAKDVQIRQLQAQLAPFLQKKRKHMSNDSQEQSEIARIDAIQEEGEDKENRQTEQPLKRQRKARNPL
jgi:hypothetical protein